MDDLDYYLQIVIGKDAGLLFLCIFGAILNSIMLYMLLSKKQVRSSVHTVYMVQIALTDLLVCAVWLVLTSVITHNLLQMRREPQSDENLTSNGGESNGSTRYATAVADEESSPSQYRSWRIMYTCYNFHYYTNILLLASMSVERCAAVWKSMRCQRYQYNRKVIIGVSVFMWIVAFAFVLPNLINPDLMVSDSDSPDSVSRTIKPDEVPSVSPEEWKTRTSDTLFEVFRDRPTQDIELGFPPHSGSLTDENAKDPLERPFEIEENTFKEDMDTLYACYHLILQAVNDDRSYVQDYKKISVDGCVTEILGITHTYSPEFRENISKDMGEPNLEYSIGDYYAGLDLNYNTEYNYPSLDEELKTLTEDPMNNSGDTPTQPHQIVNKTTGDLEGVDRELYQQLLVDAVKALIDHHYQFRSDRNEACDPNLSEAARVYVLVVNLVLGFFVPFSIIVFSYVSIACMIGKRARSRMQPSASETSTTHFAHHYTHNQSTTNIPLGPIHMRERHSRARQADSMGRRMSDFMRYVLLRKPQSGADNRTYWTESDRECTPYGSMQKMPYSSSSRRYEESSAAHAKSDNGAIRSAAQSSESKESEEGPLCDPELQEAIRQLNSVQLRHSGEDLNAKVNPRIKKYSFCYDATNENIPQTIVEHPLELADDEDERFLTASNGSCTDSIPPGARNHAALLMVQRNSRRESGGSYGSSMDSMATDQTSLMTSLHDKRYSAATTMSALTPPTPIEPCNPNSNAFFPNSEDKLAYNRSQSAESGYPLLGDHKDSQHVATEPHPTRSQKPGSQLNDITLKLYRKSLQKKQLEDTEFDSLPKLKEDEARKAESSDSQVPSTSGSISKLPPRERSSYPRMTRSKSAPEDRLNSTKLNAKSTARLINDQSRLSNGDGDEGQGISHQPKYHRQNSSASTVFYNRGRTYSSASRGSVAGTNTLRKTMARKNAERHLRVSRTVLAYVIVFSICWLPQRITYLLYVIDALIGASNSVCIKLISGTRLLSFISVLLNPAVYILTQRDFRAYVRNSLCVTKLRHWYAKCTQKTVVREEFNLDTRGRPATSDRHEDVELQIRREPDEKELSGNGRQTNGTRSPYRTTSPQRTAIHARKSSGGGQHEMFAPAGVVNARRRDATIDEMKEEEAAAEESLEKEMQRLAAEENSRHKDDINKNFLESSEDDVISAKNTSGSGNKTTSSSSKSENFEEFWLRWLQSGGADLLSPPNGNLSSTDSPSGLDPSLAELGHIAQSKLHLSNATNNGISESGVLE